MGLSSTTWRISPIVRIIISFNFLLISPYLLADCISLVKGVIAMDIESCGVINPEATFDTTLEKYQFILDLPKKERDKFYNSYRGLLVKGKVVRSHAVRSGLNPEKGALSGEDVSMYIHPGKGVCKKILKKRLKAYVDQACCEGGGNAPCLLPTSYVLTSFKPIGKADSSAGDKERKLARRSKLYKKADSFFRKRNYKKAVELYENVKHNEKLDVRGYYRLGLSYRKLDNCLRAIPNLRHVYDKSLEKKVWADEEEIVRKAGFLLARCYSKLHNADKAVVILGGYLLDPKKYRRELQYSLSHKDFGWIKTTKEYKKYQKDARDALRGK